MKLCLFLLLSIFAASSVAAQTNGFKNPQAAANALYTAWRTTNKAQARRAADDKTIDKLFSTRFQPKWKFAGCKDESDTEKGLFQCVYKDLSDELLSVAFDIFKTKRGWRVRRLTFGAEG